MHRMVSGKGKIQNIIQMEGQLWETKKSLLAHKAKAVARDRQGTDDLSWITKHGLKGNSTGENVV